MDTQTLEYLMNRPPPPLNFVRSFESAARHLSFTLAAHELRFTQAAISGHVRALEQYIGQPLFHRNARSLALTETGKAFLPNLREALRQIDTATHAISTPTRGEQISISCPVSLAESVVVERVSEFLKENSDIRVSVYGAVWDNASDAIADLKMCFYREHEAPPEAKKLWNDTLVLVCSDDWQKKMESGVPFKELPIISILGRHDYWETYVAGLNSIETAQEIRHHANSLNIAMEMAAHGLGAVVTLSSLASSYLDKNRVVEPLSHRAESPWGCYISLGKGGSTPAASRLMQWMIEQANN